MSGPPGNGTEGCSHCAGCLGLSLISEPLTFAILDALRDGPRPLSDLRRAAGSPPQTTMRTRLQRLSSLGAVERHQEPGFPGSVDCSLTPGGAELLHVGDLLDRWLERLEGGASLGTAGAKAAVKALVDGWSSRIVRAIAARPLPLTELSRLITSLNYPALERRVGAMKLAGLAEVSPGPGRGTPYTASAALRRGVGPLTAAAAWERRYAPVAASPLGRIEIEACFLLAVPLVELATDAAGVCRLAVELRRERERQFAGVTVRIDQGRVATCRTPLKGEAQGWAAGGAEAWLHAVVQGEPSELEIGGDRELAQSLLEGLHKELFREGSTRAAGASLHGSS